MNKKITAIILELIPLVSVAVSFYLIIAGDFSGTKRMVISITFLLAFLGFIPFIVGRKIAGEYRAVQLLGILDLVTTIYVIGFYVLAIFSFGL